MLSTDRETGNTRRKVSDPVTMQEWPPESGYVVGPEEVAPIGQTLAHSELGRDAMESVERINDAQGRLADFRALWDQA